MTVQGGSVFVLNQEMVKKYDMFSKFIPLTKRKFLHLAMGIKQTKSFI